MCDNQGTTSIGIVKTGAGTVNTALPGAKIQKIGRSNPIEIEIAGTSPPIRTSIQPIVVDQLSDPLNLGSGFLHDLSVQQGIPINLRYDGDKSFLEIGGQQVEMIRTLVEPPAEQVHPTSETERSRPRVRAPAKEREFTPTRIRKSVYADATINLKRDTLTFVPAKY